MKARGESVYNGLCVNCHEHGLNRAPQRFTLSFMTPETVLKAMKDGVMRLQTGHLSMADKEAVAQYLTSRKLGESDESRTLMCSEDARTVSLNQRPVLDGWGFDPENSHSIPDDYAGIDRSNVGSLAVKWVMSYPGAVRARSQPLVVGDTVFVGSQSGTVYALDLETGCARWTFSASAEVKTGLVIEPWNIADKNADPLLFFGDLIGNQYAVKARSGELVFAGSNDGYLRAYDRKTGKVLWEADTAQSFETVNGGQARGGSIGGSGSAIAVGGKLITNSGYAFAGKMPGGVLIVYEIK